MKHFLKLNDLTNTEMLQVIDKAIELKKSPEKYTESLKGKTLLMIFQKPSLRTRVSFETGMTKLGGHAIYYDTSTSPMGKGETIHDTANCAARFVDIMMARLFEHKDIEEFARNSRVPVINALTNFSHPCQILADLMTIKEKKGRLKGLTVAYSGDGNNNVTHSLIEGCAKAGVNIRVASPEGAEYEPNADVVDEAVKIAKDTGARIVVTSIAKDAVKDADVIVTDTWMSYHTPKEQKEERVRKFTPYQINPALMSHAARDAIFMHCLPAYRGFEVVPEVIDGPRSVVFDEAENRMWTEMALMLKLLGKF